MATLSDVARRAGVSVSAVSRALTDAPGTRLSAQTRDRIRAAASELHYQPNFAGRALKSTRTNVIALVAPDLTNSFLTDLIMGIEEEATRRNYVLLLGRAEDLTPDGELLRRLLGEGRVDGVLVQVGDDTTQAELNSLVQADLPIVLINSLATGRPGGVVLPDAEGARVATQHLIDIGHRHIGLIGGLPHLYTARMRFNGFRTALETAGLSVRQEWITELGYRPSQGRAGLRQIMSRSSQPSAVVVANANAAVAVLHECRRLQLDVPGGLSVVSVHDSWTAENTWPPLTAVKMPMYQLGVAAVSALYDRMRTSSASDHVVADPPPQLNVRESTSAPAGFQRDR